MGFPSPGVGMASSSTPAAGWHPGRPPELLQSLMTVHHLFLQLLACCLGSAPSPLVASCPSLPPASSVVVSIFDALFSDKDSHLVAAPPVSEEVATTPEQGVVSCPELSAAALLGGSRPSGSARPRLPPLPKRTMKMHLAEFNAGTVTGSCSLPAAGPSSCADAAVASPPASAPEAALPPGSNLCDQDHDNASADNAHQFT